MQTEAQSRPINEFPVHRTPPAFKNLKHNS